MRSGTLLLALLTLGSIGCTRSDYRMQADRMTYPLIAARETLQPGYDIGRLRVEPDPISRLADPYDPDRPPKPPDDPASAIFMARPGGMKGSRIWERHGVAESIEPKGWEATLPIGPNGTVRLDQNLAVSIALVNSREYQSALEDVYLAALSLTLNRFEFEVHWFGTNSTTFTHTGTGGTPTETNTLAVPSEVGFTRNLAAGGQLMVDFANSLVYEYSGGTSVVTSNILISLTQPLLRNFSRMVRLETLTQSERDLLYAVRTFAHYRKQFWAGVAVQSGGYLDLLLAVQTLRNTEANLKRQEETYRLYNELFRGARASVVELDQFYQSLQSARQSVIDATVSLESAKDQFKLRLGVPPRIPIELDDRLLDKFILATPESEQLRDRLEAFQRARFRELDAAPSVDDLRTAFLDLRRLAEAAQNSIIAATVDLNLWGIRMEKSPATDVPPEERERELTTYVNLKKVLAEAKTELNTLTGRIAQNRERVSENTRREGWDMANSDAKQLLGVVDTVISAQTQARIYTIELTEVTAQESDAIGYAKENRLDLQNLMGAVTDSWRKVAVAANALRGDVQEVANINPGTDPFQTKPFNFAASGSTYSVGLQIDAPLNRVAERNAYRASIITYQRARRAYMAQSDQIEAQIRQDLRLLNRLRVGFGIARQQLLSAARQYENARLTLLGPRDRRGANDATTLNLLQALTNLLAARNALVASYINFEQQRLQLLLDLESLQLDARECLPMSIQENPTKMEFPREVETLEMAAPASLPVSPDKTSLLNAPPTAKVVGQRGRFARLGRWLAIAGAILLIGWLAIGRVFSNRSGEDVLTATATVGDLVIIVADKGELESAESVQVSCEVEGGGKIVTILPEGTQVKKGEVVTRFDTDVLLKGINEQEVKWEQSEGKVKTANSDLEVQKNKAESEISKAELALTLADIDFEAYQKGEYQVELDKRKGTLEIGRKELKEAEDNLEFTRGMVKKGFAQLEQIRVMELTSEGKRYAVRQQEADLNVFELYAKRRKITELEAKAKEAARELDRTKKTQAAATEKAENELKAARKTAELEKRQLERLKSQLDKCEVKAPQDGIVIYFKRPWDESAKIRPGATVFFQQPIFNLPDLSKMKVKMKVHESVVKKVKAGLDVTMKIDALPNQTLHGKVLSVATLAQGDDWRGGGVKEYETIVSVDDLPKEAGLRPGMSADLKIHVKTVPAALTIPVQAVTEVRGNHVCYVAIGNTIERREVEIGEGNDQLVQIVKGLSEDDRVALNARSRASAEMGNQKSQKGAEKVDEAKTALAMPTAGGQP